MDATTADMVTVATPPRAPALLPPAVPPPPPPPPPPTPPRIQSLYYWDLYNRSSSAIMPSEETDGTGSVQLSPCPICSRTFKPDTLQKHVGICERTATRRRNVFDSRRQRREGTELAAYPLPKDYGLPPALAPKRENAREQSPKLQQLASPVLTRKRSNDDFSGAASRSSMRRRANSTNEETAPPTPAITGTNTPNGGGHFTRDRMRSSERSLAKRTQPPPSERCPHCDRCFGNKAYDRHVEWCKEKALQEAMKQSGSKSTQNVVKERLAARIKYRAPCLKTKRSVNRDKYSVDENGAGNSSYQDSLMSLSMTSSMASESGLTDKYDPFVSAKRQLEDLCSPNESQHSANTSQTSAPLTPGILPGKMSTSLTLSSTTPHTSPLTPNNSQQPRPSNLAYGNKSTSNFRRTSSLRGPRRSPLLPVRPPLFAQNYRPTIQRGLSDEGPISTNFLKPEEFDEMPVRAVCANDFGVTKSPRVVRRDTANSNRKHNLKININGGCINDPINGTTAAGSTTISPLVTPAANNNDDKAASKYISKTDSLAVFLKYEHELEKLNAVAAQGTSKPKMPIELDCRSGEPYAKSVDSSSNTPSTQIVASSALISTKDLKDKSNTLSKQNSTKSIKLEETDTPAKGQPQKPTLGSLPMPFVNPMLVTTSKPASEILNQSNKPGQVRLEPIFKPGTILPCTPATRPATSACQPKSVLPVSTQLPIVQQQPATVKLLSIFGDSTHKSAQLNERNQCLPGDSTHKSPALAGLNERRHYSSNGSDYIDPKLINKCDNLPVNLTNTRGLQLDTGSSLEKQQGNSSSSTDSSTAAVTSPISQLTKLLPLGVKDNSVQAQHSPPPTELRDSEDSSQFYAPNQSVSNDRDTHTVRRNSAEGRNLLKRKLRLGRNQFLYDASPEAEADSCSADDETNRSSVEYSSSYDEQSLNQQRVPPTPPQRTPKTLPTTPPAIPPLPIFDDFDFEEFLSSFENDDEPFPLFKDCREFLLNRSGNKHRTMQPKYNNNKPSTQATHPTKQSPPPINVAYTPNHIHFQFPSLSQIHACPSLLTTSNPRSRSMLSNKDNRLNLPGPEDEYRHQDHLQPGNKNREIFISIETEENHDQSHESLSPRSMRKMVGADEQAMLDFEVDNVHEADNEFTKISDDDEPAELSSRSSHFALMRHRQLPNVQMNNAKNLMQQMKDDFRLNNEEMTFHQRQAVDHTEPNADVERLLYGFDSEETPTLNKAKYRVQKLQPEFEQEEFGHTTADAECLLYEMDNVQPKTVDAGAQSDDDNSSLDGYSISTYTSRRDVVPKMSADSAYGSLSRQRSSELSTQSSHGRMRPTTSNTTANMTKSAPKVAAAVEQPLRGQQKKLTQTTPQTKYSAMKDRSRRLDEHSSSSGSDRSMPSIANNRNNNCNNNYENEQYAEPKQQQQQRCNNNNIKDDKRNNNHLKMKSIKQSRGSSNSNNSSKTNSATTLGAHAAAAAALAVSETTTTNDAAAVDTGGFSCVYTPTAATTLTPSTSNASMASSTKSKFCHECGSKFILEQAKFCMDCGVKRIIL